MAKKSPFKNYTEEQVLAAEATTFLVVVGTDVYDVKGRWFFDNKSANRHYNKIMNQLLFDINYGTSKEKRNAQKVLPTVRIVSLKLH